LDIARRGSTHLGLKQFTIGYPNCGNTLLILPVSEAIFAAYYLKVAVDISTGEELDFLSILGLNELLDTFDIPAPLPLRDGHFNQIIQIVIKESSGGIRD
jgi:hypothetical protein